MKISKYLGFSALTYILVLFGAYTGASVYELQEVGSHKLVFLGVLLLLIVICHFTLLNTYRNIANYLFIGILFGVFTYEVAQGYSLEELLVSSLYGLVVILIVLLFRQFKINQPIVYLVYSMVVGVFIIYTIMNSNHFETVLNQIFFVVVIPFMTFINLSNYVHNGETDYFSKNPFIISIFPIMLFSMPSTSEVLVPEPYEVEKKEDDDEEQ